ncbi:LamG-like jellyroll fold domain-containing protein [Streptomyces sp. DSM 42041]|uniref:LamG-like jellyroll fold domain-containing protein n=1 Tax=Streptomyces hazeniae TaxID=3075538 RepID=A0ABU2NVD0_9ACTN|nr:LamG-like jellyroll fold domain-containing protein [Streptomyces sp. DSM 42041]MDT0380680.1 LamG-like jellyroll fold domain-containing protein [Streptomyces sp. DSM 42041]
MRYDAERCAWSFEVRDADEDAAPSTRVVAAGDVPARDGFGDHLALAYDPVLGEVALYLNGDKATESVEWHPEWDFSTVGVDVGRTGGASTGADFFSGEVDEVRVFDGALDQDAISALPILQSGAELDPDGPDIG